MADLDVKVHTFQSVKFQSVMNEALAFFEATPEMPLPLTTKFCGVGIYAIYFRGKFAKYAPIAKINAKAGKLPIYVGKAVPEGWRQGRRTSVEDNSLFRRLNEHARSISQAKNLRLSDFTARFMVLNGIENDLIGTVEAGLIRKYHPLWNSVIDGFGNHDPGKGRYEQSISEWDILHPGRGWTKNLHNRASTIPKITHKIRGTLQDLK
ncbi:MAG: Eco29kI family restriction endonuclease [Candidatus Micrarchaeia archaeon]|jgi:hypothetical protein